MISIILKTFKNLEKFSLKESKKSIYRCLDESDVKSFMILTNSFRRLLRLKIVNLAIGSLFIRNSFGFDILISGIKKLSQTNEFYFEIPGYSDNVPNESICKCIHTMKSIKSLKVLKIDVGQIHTDSIIRILAITFSFMSELTVLHISACFIAYCSDSALESLFSSLILCQKLHELRMLFDTFSEFISPNCLQTLYNIIQHLYNLRELCFGFNKLDCSSFINQLRNLKQIHKLLLLRIDSLEHFSSGLDLQLLELRLNSSEQPFLQKTFMNLSKLRELVIFFNHNSKPSLFQSFADSLRFLLVLQKLQIVFGTLLQNETLGSVWSSIRKRTTLKSLELDFKQGLGGGINDAFCKVLEQNLGGI